MRLKGSQNQPGGGDRDLPHSPEFHPSLVVAPPTPPARPTALTIPSGPAYPCPTPPPTIPGPTPKGS